MPRPQSILLRIAGKEIESRERLCRNWRVIERTRAWCNRARRLSIGERRADIYEAFSSLVASLVTLSQIEQLCHALPRRSRPMAGLDAFRGRLPPHRRAGKWPGVSLIAVFVSGALGSPALALLRDRCHRQLS